MSRDTIQHVTDTTHGATQLDADVEDLRQHVAKAKTLKAGIEALTNQAAALEAKYGENAALQALADAIRVNPIAWSDAFCANTVAALATTQVNPTQPQPQPAAPTPPHEPAKEPARK